ERDGDGWRISGEKTSISLGMHADSALVFARTAPGGARGVSAFYVDLDDRHVTRSAFSDLRSPSIGRASLFFDAHPAPPGSLIVREGEGCVGWMQGFAFSRALISLACLGAAAAPLDEAMEYAKDRHTMGVPIGRHQGVAFPLIEYVTYVRAARLLSYEALW